MTPQAVVTRRGAERIRRGHPWIFRSDVVDVAAEPGDIVRVTVERARPGERPHTLGWATFSAASQITLRMISRDAGDLPDLPTWLAARVEAASAFRKTLEIESTAWRLVNAEADGLPATIVDRYGDAGGAEYFVVQALSQGAQRWLPALVDVLVNYSQPRAIVVRNDPKVRQLEGLDSEVYVAWGEAPDRVSVREGGIVYQVDLRAGQKTGLFLDQRENHRAAAGYTRGDALDAFTYNGGFALQMAARAASVLALDSSAAAVAATRENAERNGLQHVEVREANVFDELRELEISRARFDTISLDPPAFAKNKASITRALAGYKEINLRAMRLLRPGGHLITCSCSYNVDETMFLNMLQEAAADAHATMGLVEKRTQARDHPMLLAVPETSYLKCMVLRKI